MRSPSRALGASTRLQDYTLLNTVYFPENSSPFDRDIKHLLIGQTLVLEDNIGLIFVLVRGPKPYSSQRRGNVFIHPHKPPVNHLFEPVEDEKEAWTTYARLKFVNCAFLAEYRVHCKELVIRHFSVL